MLMFFEIQYHLQITYRLEKLIMIILRRTIPNLSNITFMNFLPANAFCFQMKDKYLQEVVNV